MNLFDVNGSFGIPVISEPEFKTPADLLAHMNRLGVSRSLVWNVPGRNHHCDTGNRELLSAIAGEERFVPAFSVGLDMLLARDGLKHLQSQRVRALRLFPTSLRFNPIQIAPVIEAVAAHTPVLVGDMREMPDPAAFAERFPNLPLIVTHAMWGHLFPLLDAMRRCPNMLADISWLHSNGTIELLCRQFGAKRVVFGLGGRAHQGACIAALQLAEIRDDERELIAHGNLDRLLGLPATKPQPATITQPLWNKFIQGKPLGVEIIDAHGHLGPLSYWPMDRQELADQIPQTLRDMNRCGIQTLVVSGLHALMNDPVTGNDLLAEKLTPHGERFRGWIVLNPFQTDRLMPHLDRWLANPFFVGIKIHPDSWRLPVTDPRYEYVWRTANTHRLPILMHTWDSPNNSPAMFRDICPKYPHAAFIFGHAGGGDRGRREAEDIVATNSNTWLEWCGSFCSSIPWEETLPKIGKDRLLFGTDAVVHNFAWELGRYLSLDLPEEMLRPALSDNWHALLKRRETGPAPKRKQTHVRLQR